MLRLSTFALGRSEDRAHAGIVEALSAWDPGAPFALLSAFADPVPPGACPRILVVTRAVWDRHGADISATARPGDRIFALDADAPAPTVHEVWPRAEAAAADAPGADAGVSCPDPYDPSEPLLPDLVRAIAGLPERDAEILRSRLGLDGPAALLATLASKFGVRGERVRQIQEAALAKVEARTGFLARLARVLEPVASGVPVPLDALRAQPWAGGLPDEAFRIVLERSAGIQAIQVGAGPPLACGFSQGTWDAARQRLVALVAFAGLDDPVADILSAFDADNEGRRERAGLLALARAVLGTHATAAGAKAELRLRADIVARLLPPPGKSFHRSAIREKLRALGLSEQFDDRKLDAVLDGMAVRIDGGTFVRAAESRDAQAVARRAKALMRTGDAARRWKTGEILDALRTGGDGSGGEPMPDLDLGGVEMALGADPTFRRVRAGIWRIDAADARSGNFQSLAAEVLAEAGGPLRRPDLIARTMERWGRPEYPLLNPDGRICQVDRAVWGLVHRDIPVNPAVRKIVVRDAAAALSTARWHVADLYLSMEGVCRRSGIGNATLLGTLVSLDLGYTVGRGGLLRPPGEAAAPRRGSIKAQVVEVLRSSPDGITRREVLDRIEMESGSRPSEATVTQTLRAHGRNVGYGLWVAADGPDAPEPLPQRPRGPAPKRPGKPPGLPRDYPLRRRRPVMPPARYDWTPERVEILTAMVRDGRASPEIRKALGGGVSKSAVNAKVHRLGLSVPSGEALRHEPPARAARKPGGTAGP